MHSLLPVLQGETVERSWPIDWQFGVSRAIRDRGWKRIKHGKGEWELYDVAEDPTELNNLASTEPHRAARMIAAWESWWANKGQRDR